jgi:valyl-tRNA synthetase
METGYDIIFFWVARMIMLGLENTGDIPFRTVYLHGLVRDEKGEKMSKLKGNVLSPLDVIDEYGADALRFALTTGSAPGNDVRLSYQKLEASRNFANKLWNATRFVLRSIQASPTGIPARPSPLPVEDRWILSRLSRLVASVDRLSLDFQFGEAQRQIHDFLWGEFCDWYIELAKNRFPSPLPVLVHVLETSLRLLHPFMPFVTEELWQRLRPHLPPDRREDSIMIAPYPSAEEEAVDPEAEAEMERVIEIIRSIRNARAQYKVKAATWIEVHIYANEVEPAIRPHARAIETLARIRALTIAGSRAQRPERDKALVLVLSDVEVVLPMAGIIDLEAERRSLREEIEISQSEIARLKAKLKDREFLTKAPQRIVAREQEKLATSEDKLERLEQQLAQLG